MPRSALRPPAARVVASRAMDALCRLLEGGSTALKALSRRPYRPRRTWAAGAFIGVKYSRVRRERVASVT